MNFLDHFVSPDALVARNHKGDKGGAHIFVELMSYFKEDLSVEEYMNLFYLHSLCEKTISYWLSKDYNSGNITYAQVCNIDRSNFPEQVKEGAETIFLACTGYHYYAEKKYDIAADKINAAIIATLSQKEKMPDFSKALYEHNLNLIRIYIRTKNETEIVDYFSRLLNALFFNIQHPVSHSSELKGLTEAQRETWLHYVLNNVFFALQRTFKDDELAANRILKQTLENVFSNAKGEYSFNPSIQQSLHAILAFIQGDDDTYIDLVCNQFDVIREAPNFVKRQILANHVNWAEARDEELTDHENYKSFSAIAEKFGIKMEDNMALKKAV